MAIQDTYTVEIPAAQLEERAGFEAARQRAYREEDPQLRTERLTELVDSTQLKGNVSLGDVILETVTRDDDTASEREEKAKTRLEAISEAVATTAISGSHEEITYSITLGSDAMIRAIARLTPIPKDQARIERARRTAEQIGWGRKQNDTSFKSSGYVRGQRRI